MVVSFGVATAPPGASDTSAGITFAGEQYASAQLRETTTSKTMEYVRPLETQQQWTKKVAVHLLPYDQDPLDYAQAVKESVTLYNSEAQAKALTGSTTDEAYINFQSGNSKEPTTPYEWHVVRIRKQTAGLILYEFVFRSSGHDAQNLEDFHRGVQQSQTAWEKELRTAQWPVPAADPSISEKWKKAVASIRWYIHSPHVFVEKKLIEAPFSLGTLPKPPEHAWLYVRPAVTLDAASLSVFLDAMSAYRVTGLDLKKQTAVTVALLSEFMQPHADWPLQPGWRTLLDGLRYLNVKGTLLNDHAAPVLAKMLPLQVLILNDVITDEGLKTIATALTNLVKFRPGGPLITDHGLSALSGLHKLHRLDLTDTSVTDQGLKALTGLPLIEVDLGSKIGDGALDILSAIPTLVHLQLDKTHISDQGVLALKKFQNLHTLFVGPQLDDAGIQTLIQIPSLRRLDLSGSRVTDTGLLTLGALKDLEELGLTQTAVSDKGLTALSHMDHLRYLEVSATQVSIAGLAQLKNLPALDVISLSHVGTLKLRDLRPLGALPALKTLIINGAPLRHEAVDYLHKHAQPQARTFFWEALAYAESMIPLPMTDDTDVVHLTQKRSPMAMSDVGLRRIHDVESDLDHVIPDVGHSKIAANEDTPQNFLGEFSVNATPSKPIHD